MVFLIELVDVKPRVWREVAVPEDYTFEDFHEVIQRAMGWEDYHMHSFDIYKGSKRYTIAPVHDVFDDFDVLDERKQKLIDWIDKKTELFYTYDFGDEWVHSIKLLKIVDNNSNRPILIGGMGACPPEDSGGPRFYNEMVTALKDPDHQLHEMAIELLGEGFKPDEFDPGLVDFSDLK